MLDLIRHPPYRPAMGRRRFLLTSLAGALAAPLGVEAQQPGKAHKLGFLAFSPADASLDGAFRRGLRELGYIEGRNLAVEYRSADGQLNRRRHSRRPGRQARNQDDSYRLPGGCGCGRERAC